MNAPTGFGGNPADLTSMNLALSVASGSLVLQTEQETGYSAAVPTARLVAWAGTIDCQH